MALHLEVFDLVQGAINNGSLQRLAAAPTSPAPIDSQFYYDTVKKSIGVYDSSTPVWNYYLPSLWRLDQLAAPTASVSMNSQKIINQLNGSAAQDSATMNNIALTTLNGLALPTAALPMNAQKITGMANGSAAQDSATIANITLTALNALAVPTGAVAMNAQKITGLALGVALTDAANMQNIQNLQDQVQLGLAWKGAVRSVFTANVANLSAAGSSNDGVTFVNNDKILLTAQTTTSQNGAYLWTTGGVLIRAGDAASNYDLTEGASWEVTEGTLGNPSGTAPQRWYLTNTGTITPGTTAITIVFIGSGGATVTGSTGINVTSNVVSILAGYRAQKATGSIGDGSSTSIAVTDSLGTIDKIAIVRDATTGALVFCDITYSATQTTFGPFRVAPASAAYKYVILTVV